MPSKITVVQLRKIAEDAPVPFCEHLKIAAEEIERLKNQIFEMHVEANRRLNYGEDDDR